MRILINDTDARTRSLYEHLKRQVRDVGLFYGKYSEGPPYILVTAPSLPPEVLLTLLDIMPQQSVLIGGMSDKSVAEYAYSRDINYQNVTADEAFATANAILTAEGAIALLVQHTRQTLCGMNIAIVGLGRIGKRLYTCLCALGANVLPIGMTDAECAWARPSFSLNDMKNVLPICEAIINTVPARVIDNDTLCALMPATFLLELASSPGGFDRVAAERFELEVLYAPGLPGRFCPDSAAQIFHEIVKKIISEVDI